LDALEIAAFRTPYLGRGLESVAAASIALKPTGLKNAAAIWPPSGSGTTI
jgi:hypothetical protein